MVSLQDEVPLLGNSSPDWTQITAKNKHIRAETSSALTRLWGRGEKGIEWHTRGEVLKT